MYWCVNSNTQLSVIILVQLFMQQKKKHHLPTKLPDSLERHRKKVEVPCQAFVFQKKARRRSMLPSSAMLRCWHLRENKTRTGVMRRMAERLSRKEPWQKRTESQFDEMVDIEESGAFARLVWVAHKQRHEAGQRLMQRGDNEGESFWDNLWKESWWEDESILWSSGETENTLAPSYNISTYCKRYLPLASCLRRCSLSNI